MIILSLKKKERKKKQVQKLKIVIFLAQRTIATCYDKSRDSSSETGHVMMGTVLAYGKILPWQ